MKKPNFLLLILEVEFVFNVQKAVRNAILKNLMIAELVIEKMDSANKKLMQLF